MLKKTISLLLSGVLLFSAVPLLNIAGANTPLWRQLEGSGSTQITETAVGVYSAVQSEPKGTRIVTAEAYDFREKAIQFKASVPDETTWYTLGIAGENAEIGNFWSGQNRVDLIMHCKGDPWVYTYQDGIGYRAKYGQHNYNGYTDIHTFGLTKEGENWYFTIDDDVLNQAVDQPLNDILNSNEKVYFIIGANCDYQFTDIKIVDNQQYKPWVQTSGNAEYLKNRDGSYKLTGNGELTSGELYDIEDYELSFKSSASDGKGLRVSVSRRDSDGNIIQKGLYLPIGDGDCNIGWFGEEGYVSGVKSTALSAEKSHTFGVKKRDGVYYPTIDGTTVFFPEGAEWQNRQAEFSDFVKANNGVLSFTLSSENGLALDNVCATLREPEWIQRSIFNPGTDVSLTQKQGSYTFTGKDDISFLTTDTYDLTNTEITFKFTKLSNNGWAHLSVASDKPVDTIANALAYESTPSRVDFVFYMGENQFFRDGLNESGSIYRDASYSAPELIGITHTFGLTKQGENWYPVIDGVVKSVKSDYLNEFMRNNDISRLRFGIGAFSNGSGVDLAIENVKTVSKTVIWQASGSADSLAANSSDKVTELYYAGAPTKYKTVSTYDVTKKEFTFEFPSFTKEWLFVGVSTDTVARGLFLRPGNNPIGHLGYDSTSWFDIANMEQRTFNSGEKHSFGVREKDGKYYPAIDGKIVTGDNNVLSLFNDFVAENGGNLHFEIYYCQDEKFSIKNVEIINANTLWQTSDGTGLAVTVDDNGIYTANSDKCVTTVQKYDLTEYDVSFKYTTNSNYLSLFISDNIAQDFSSAESTDNAESTHKIEFAAAYNGDWVFAFNPEYGQSDAINCGSKLIDFSLPHTYGVRKLNGHWYLAIDGRILNTSATSTRLDDFMTKKSTTEFYISVGTNNSGDGTKYTAEDLKMVKHSEYGDWIVKSGGGIIEKANDGTYTVNGYNGCIITKDVYDITEKDMAFNISELTGDWLRFGLAAADEAVSVNIASKELIARLGQKMYVSYFLGTTEDVITARKYDFNTRHTFGVRKLDGHWYPAIDGAILNYNLNVDFDEFIEANKDRGMRFTIGSQLSFSASSIEIIASVPSSVKEPEGWDYFGSEGYGELVGNEKDGYEMEVPKGYSFAFSNAKYDLTKTSLSFNLEDVGEWLYFGVSTVDAFKRPSVLPDKNIEMPELCAFILRPTDSHAKVTVSYWSPNHDGIETNIRTVPMDWYSDHTLDIRKVGNNWFVCLDGVIMQTKLSPVFNSFMEANEGKPLHYVIGSLYVGLTLHNIKVIDQVPLDVGNDEVYEDGTLDDDYGFDFSEDSNYENDFEDMNFGFDTDNDFSNNKYDESGEKDYVTAKVKKRKLVSAGHGWIFTKLEIAAMIVGGVIVLAGITVSGVFLVRKIKKKKRSKVAQ